MSEAKSAQRAARPDREIALAVLELFELLVANARDRGDNVEDLGAWADEWKPRLESIVHNAKLPSTPRVSTG